MIYLIAVKSIYEYEYKEWFWSEKQKKTLKIVSNVKPVYAHNLQEAFEKYQARMGKEITISLGTIFSDDYDGNFCDIMTIINDKNTISKSNTFMEINKSECFYNIKYLIEHLPAEDFKAWWVENNPKTDNSSNFSETLIKASSED